MTIRERAYNVIKALKKAWFEEYCDVQKVIEEEFGPLVEALEKIGHTDCLGKDRCKHANWSEDLVGVTLFCHIARKALKGK